MKASSSWDKYHRACRGRLNTVKQGHHRGAWSPKTRYKQWIQVRLSRPTPITKILTQGRQDANQWVTKYFVTYSINGRRFSTYKIGGKKRVSFNSLKLNSSAKATLCCEPKFQIVLDWWTFLISFYFGLDFPRQQRQKQYCVKSS